MTTTKKDINKTDLKSNQIKENISKLVTNIEEVQDIIKLLPNVIERDIIGFGNSSHIILPKKYENKKAIVIIK